MSPSQEETRPAAPTNSGRTRTLAPAALQRRGTALTRLLFYLSVPMGLASAAWITAGRALFGAGGSLVPVFAISFGLALAVILLVATYFSARELKLQEAGVRAGLPALTALVLASTWAMAGIFGLLVPDRVNDVTVSAASQLLGADFIGLSAGFGNTTGILTFAFAIASLLLALSDYRKARSLSRGLDDITREELEREESIYDFLD